MWMATALLSISSDFATSSLDIPTNDPANRPLSFLFCDTPTNSQPPYVFANALIDLAHFSTLSTDSLNSTCQPSLRSRIFARSSGTISRSSLPNGSNKYCLQEEDYRISTPQQNWTFIYVRPCRMAVYVRALYR